MGVVDYEHIARQSVELVNRDTGISDKNKKDFGRYLQALDVSAARVGIIANHIKLLFHELPDVVGSMQERDLVNRTFKRLSRNLKPGYYETVKSVSKAYVRWHNDSETPAGWKDIKGNNKKAQRRNLRPEDMVTWEDGLNLANATNSVQIKAALLVQLDGGFRPSEFIDLNYGDISIKKTFAVAHVKRGKTGPRDVILFRSVPYLQRWLMAHPRKKKDAPLWVQENGRELTKYRYDAMRWRVLELGRKTELQKPLDFYNLRHSACYLSKMDNTNAELAARKFGHSLEYYTQTYGRLSPDDDIKRYSRHYGLDKGKEKQEQTTTECVKCSTVNEPGIDVCVQCGNPLTLDRALDIVDDSNKLKEQVAELQEAMKLIKQHIIRDRGTAEELRKALV